MANGIVRVAPGMATLNMGDGTLYEGPVVSCTVGGVIVVPPGKRRRFRPDELPSQLVCNEGCIVVLTGWNWEIVGVQVQPLVETKTFVPMIRISMSGTREHVLSLDGGWLLKGCEPVSPFRVLGRHDVAIDVGWYGEPREEIPLHVSLRGFLAKPLG